VLPQLFATMPGGELVGRVLRHADDGGHHVDDFAARSADLPPDRLARAGRASGRAGAGRSPSLLSIPSALGNGASVPFFSSLPGIGMDFLSLMATIWNNFALPIGGFFLRSSWAGCGAARRPSSRAGETGGGMPGARLWAFLIRWVCPIAIGIIIIFTVRDLLG
jgi:SNF family Na+-dependent transporter